MSIQSDIITALASVAGGRIYPQAVPEGIAMPFVVYRRTSQDPLATLQGAEGSVNSVFSFDCYADTYAAALSTAAAVRTAIAGASGLTSYPDAGSGEDYEPVIDAFMEPVIYGFWHT